MLEDSNSSPLAYAIVGSIIPIIGTIFGYVFGKAASELENKSLTEEKTRLEAEIIPHYMFEKSILEGFYYKDKNRNGSS
ncbi:MAG: hypothetical protein LBJ09_02035 [Clostridiales bacterium]|jgi:hypothetical protein|nr:hypothetical protein [Clostridiales bacterium]